MKIYLKNKVWILLFLLAWTWWIGGGPAYCFSPGQKIEIENLLTGCQCAPTCIKVEESKSLSEVARRNLKPSFEVVSLETCQEPQGSNLFFTRFYEVSKSFKKPNPLLYVKLLF
ncbi:hypothetical protein [Thermosulfurimonas dismutans]|uniref:Uncharacterized protein n=1 Tax=Thermosulfurimonas dismutans TaxID=999894 RepID=A0A179D6W3_9BACT|nr:hypothetical protein [Thermosulfurimonas dismutans]OAQ21479.1 hypothetical protein TDIS_0700 [Thermosulfurimonas dismutans]